MVAVSLDGSGAALAFSGAPMMFFPLGFGLECVAALHDNSKKTITLHHFNQKRTVISKFINSLGYDRGMSINTETPALDQLQRIFGEKNVISEYMPDEKETVYWLRNNITADTKYVRDHLHDMGIPNFSFVEPDSNDNKNMLGLRPALIETPDYIQVLRSIETNHFTPLLIAELAEEVEFKETPLMALKRIFENNDVQERKNLSGRDVYFIPAKALTPKLKMADNPRVVRASVNNYANALRSMLIGLIRKCQDEEKKIRDFPEDKKIPDFRPHMLMSAGDSYKDVAAGRLTGIEINKEIADKLFVRTYKGKTRLDDLHLDLAGNCIYAYAVEGAEKDKKENQKLGRPDITGPDHFLKTTIPDLLRGR